MPEEGKKHMKTKIIPVIHYQDNDQAIRNAERASAAGCDGVLLIEMNGSNTRLVPMAQEIKTQWPDLLVGVNHLGLDPSRSLAVNLAADLDMTWTDMQPTHTEFPDDELKKRLSRQLRGKSHHLFVGVAFKHQRHEPDPVASARDAVTRGFIPTTSGPATGIAADPSQIARLRRGIGPEAPLGIASGITPGNFAMFAPHLSHVLVATGISSSFYELDEGLLAELISENG